MFKSVPRVLAALGPALVYIFARNCGHSWKSEHRKRCDVSRTFAEAERTDPGVFRVLYRYQCRGENRGKVPAVFIRTTEIQYDLPEREMAFDTVEFADVSLKNERGTVLDGISFRIEKGEK